MADGKFLNNTNDQNTPQGDQTASGISRAFREARISGSGLEVFPGPIPQSLDEAYTIQDMAIRDWPDTVAGWKVGMIVGDNIRKFGSDRLAGPIFAQSIQTANNDAAAVFQLFDGGFAAVEAELVFVLKEDAPGGKTSWDAAEAASMVAEVRPGVELAGSPFGGINDLGPAVTVADFGNNAGLVLGDAVADWKALVSSEEPFETWIEGECVGSASPNSIRGGALESLRFMLENAARRGMPLRKGQVVSSGAVTGVHQIGPGQESRFLFRDNYELVCITRAPE